MAGQSRLGIHWGYPRTVVGAMTPPNFPVGVLRTAGNFRLGACSSYRIGSARSLVAVGSRGTAHTVPVAGIPSVVGKWEPGVEWPQAGKPVHSGSISSSSSWAFPPWGPRSGFGFPRVASALGLGGGAAAGLGLGSGRGRGYWLASPNLREPGASAPRSHRRRSRHRQGPPRRSRVPPRRRRARGPSLGRWVGVGTFFSWDLIFWLGFYLYIFSKIKDIKK